jgi:UDP:flavonoid glycosyltransferase YjiC (YdhE family)
MRILFASTGGDGHVLPLLPLARAFDALADEVAFAAPANHRERIEGTGLHFEEAGPTIQDLEPQLDAHREAMALVLPAERRPAAFTGRFAEIEAPRRLDDLRALVERLQPDMLIYESADLAAALVGTAAGVRTVNHAFGLPIPEAALRRAAEAMAPHWRTAGLEPDELAGAYRGEYVTICPPSFLADLADAPPRMHPLRPADAAPSTERDSGRPLVYATLGTSFNVLDTFRVLLTAVDGMDCDVTMTVGRNRDPRDLEPVPANVVVEQYIPQAEILSRCDAVISHAGSGTLFASLAHGLPLVLLPMGADQFENAAMGRSLGFGEAILPGDFTADRVRDALVRILHEPSYGAAARSIADEIAAMPDATSVATELAAQR